MLQVHQYTSPENAFYVNAFVLENDTSLVVIDTQFLVSSATAFAERISALRKPIAGIVVTHPHPDHYNGLPQIAALAPAAPIYATTPTIAGIKATQAEKRNTWTPAYGADYPTDDALPTMTLPGNGQIEIGGIVLEIADLGAAEASDNIAIHLPQADTLLASDFVYSACHPWLAEMRTDQWLTALAQLRARYAGVATLYAGHGPAGDLSLLDAQADYIHRTRALVRAHLDTGSKLTDAAVVAIGRSLMETCPNWPLSMLIDLNSRALAEESGR